MVPTAFLVTLFMFMFTTYTNAGIIYDRVDTALGKIRGKQHVGYSTFFGIPYTEEPPTGNNRFRPATMRTSQYSAISPTFDLNAASIGAACIQPPIPTMETSEDCLTLNIWTPNVGGSLRVMVWIHGGAFEFGSGYFGGAYNGREFAKKGVVFVSLNYRLGLLGFLPLPAIAQETGNTNGGLMGNYDQIVALQWVKTYIHSFGGDPNQVTVFGESAGGLSLCTLLFSPQATGLFNKAIIESGSCTAPILRPYIPSPKAWAEDWAKSKVESYGMDPNDLNSLRARPVAEFRDLGPLRAVDGYIMPNDDIFDLSNSISQLNAKKIMIGANSIDTIHAWPYYWNVGPNKDISVFDGTPNTSAAMEMYLSSYFEHTDMDSNSDLDAYYNVNDFQSLDKFNEYQIMWLMMIADSCFVCPSFKLVDWIVDNPDHFSGAVGTDLYLYRFLGPSEPYYATHFSEIPFVFNIPLVSRGMLAFDSLYNFAMDWDQTLADNMHNVWVNFVKDVDDGNLVPYGDTQTAMIFGGANGIETVSDYYQSYRGGWCPFLSNHYSAQERLCFQDVVVNVAVNGELMMNNFILMISMMTNFILVTLLCFGMVKLKRLRSIRYAQVPLEEIENIK